MKKAILFGASGFIGSNLLKGLLDDANYQQITVVVRKALDIRHPKLKVLISDYQTLPKWEKQLVADEVFLALGTTKKKTPNQAKYYQIDHDYPVLAAKIAKEQGAEAVFLISSVGANIQSKVFYLKTKGETEHDIIALDFKYTHIFRPSLLLGNRKENRPLERIFLKIWPVISKFLVGERLKKYRGIEGPDLARAMINAAKKQSKKIKIYYWQDLKS